MVVHSEGVNPSGYMAVFDRREFDTSGISPTEIHPARFATKDEANAGLERFKAWDLDRKTKYDIFEGSIPQYLEGETGYAPNPAYENAQFELRVLSAKQPSTSPV